jgi:hypothetical protein
MERNEVRLISTAIISSVLSVGLATGWMLPGTGAAQQLPTAHAGPTCISQLRTTLYFGTARPKGSVTELQWQIFLRDEVSTRFPEGLTVWEADGQWRTSAGTIEHERTKILILVHPDTSAAREAVRSIIARYCAAFDQQSVLWETAHVNVAS